MLTPVPLIDPDQVADPAPTPLPARRATDAEKSARYRMAAARFRRGAPIPRLELPKPYPGVLPDANLAMDYDVGLTDPLAMTAAGMSGEGLGFLGYPVLAELSQRPEFRRFAEIFADHMTRKFIKLVSASDEPQSFRIKLLNDAFEKFDLAGAFHRLAMAEGLYGRVHLYPDLGVDPGDAATPLILSRETVPLHALRGFKVVEPFWTYPTGYDSRDPTRDDFYRPRAWYLMGKEYHHTRLLTFVGRPVPDILKPVYGFGGLSLTQMVKPYVDNWIRTRQNVSDAIERFSQAVLMTNLEATMAGGAGEDLDARVALFTAVASSRGVMVLDKNTESFAFESMQLGTLDKLQAQAQEQLCCLTGDTLILTDRGEIPICEVLTSDRVMTRRGWAPLAWSGRTGFTVDLIEITTAAGVLRATDYHPIWIPAINDFVTAGRVQVGDRLLGGPTSHTHTVHPSCIAESGIAFTKAAIAEIPKVAGFSIGGFGKIMSGRFRKILSCITKTKTLQTINSTISSFLLGGSTCTSIWSPAVWASHGLTFGSTKHALSVGPLTGQSARILCTAQNHVDTGRAIEDDLKVVRVEKLRVLETPVFNLEVEEGYLPEFYANGVLVHNSVAAVPTVIYLGLDPAGLNASSEGSIRTFYDTVEGRRKQLFGPHMKFVLDLIMLSELGEIHEDISYAFESLWQMSDKEVSDIRTANATAAKTYIDAGVIHPAEERERLANEESGAYQGLDPDDVPDPPAAPDLGLNLDDAGAAGDPNAEGSEQGLPPLAQSVDDIALDELVLDAWEESEHDRDHGKFSTMPGAKGSASTSKSLTKQTKPLTEQQRIEVKDYKEGNYRPLNEFLRGKPASATLSKAYAGQAKSLDQAIAKSTLTKDTTLFRGMDHPALAANAEKLIGRSVPIDSFQSASSDSRAAADFAGAREGSVMFKIEASKGTPALDMSSFESTGNAGESEYLLPRGGHMEIVSVDRSGRMPIITARFKPAGKSS